MTYDYQFTCQILLLHRNNGRNGLHFGHFEGRKNALWFLNLNLFSSTSHPSDQEGNDKCQSYLRTCFDHQLFSRASRCRCRFGPAEPNPGMNYTVSQTCRWCFPVGWFSVKSWQTIYPWKYSEVKFRLWDRMFMRASSPTSKKTVIIVFYWSLVCHTFWSTNSRSNPHPFIGNGS
jgi:hypothetical protein